MDQLSTGSLQPDRLPDEDFQHAPLPGPDYIRVLTLLPANNSNTPLACEIETRHLDESADYEALSYSWAMNADGDATLNHSLSIDGQTKLITQNLFEGLLRLRADASPSPRRLWVDAVCINQSDVEERSQQVAQMGAVYKCARRTVIWLGEGESAQEDLNMLQIAECYKQATDPSHILGTHVWRGPHGEELSICSVQLHEYGVTDHLPPRVTHDVAIRAKPILHSVGKIFARRYFSRRWIFQELWNSPQSTLRAYWGPCNGALADLFSITLPVLDLSEDCEKPLKRASYAELEDWMYPSVLQVRCTLDLVFAQRADAPSDMLPHALQKCFYMECSDPRDRLYSLLSLDPKFGIVPDYNLSITDVCIQLARRMIQSDHLVAFLLRSSRHEGHTDLNLPSWVPDLQGYSMGEWDELEPEFQHLNISISENNVLTLSPYLYGIVESVEEKGCYHLQIKLRCYGRVRTSRLKRLFRAVGHCFSTPSPTPTTWIQAREYLDAIKTLTTRYATVYVARESWTDVEPGDLCCSLTSDVSREGNHLFTVRAVQLEKGVFKLLETITLYHSSPRAIIRTTLSIV